jgi:hypothetical protein
MVRWKVPKKTPPYLCKFSVTIDLIKTIIYVKYTYVAPTVFNRRNCGVNWYRTNRPALGWYIVDYDFLQTHSFSWIIYKNIKGKKMPLVTIDYYTMILIEINVYVWMLYHIKCQSFHFCYKTYIHFLNTHELI